MPEPDHAPAIRWRGKYFEDLKQAKRTEGKQARAEACTAVKERAVAEIDSRPRGRRRRCPERFDAAWHDLEAAWSAN